MIKIKDSVLIWVALFLAVFSLFSSLKKQDGTISPTPMSIMDKIQKNRKLTCGYVTYAPYLQKNLQTGKLEGPIYDLIEELGKTLEVRINWAEETDWDTMVQSLQNKRFDTLCSFAWMDTRRAKSAQFSVPVLYNTLGAEVAKG